MQKEIFDSLSEKFCKLYNEIPPDPIEYITPFWQERLNNLRNDFSGCIPYDFLNNKTIKFTMFVDYCEYNKIEYAYLKKHLSGTELKRLLTEDDVGKPNTNVIADEKGIVTSGNTIHHLYHIMRYLEELMEGFGNWEKIGSIVEWGGGYGNMAKLFYRLNRFANYRFFKENLTYIMIDTALFSCIQWIYLSSILGEDKVKIITKPGDMLERRKINIVPLSAIADNKDFIWDIDLFISTWAISESTERARQFLIDRKCFNANRFLIAHQCQGKDFPEAEKITELINSDKYYHEEISFIPGNYYLFK